MTSIQQQNIPGIQQTLRIVCIVCYLLLLSLASCAMPSPLFSDQRHNNTFTSSSNQPITYSKNPQDILVRTFYGGGLYGSLELGPQISIYGDGTYILDLNQQGKLETKELQQLLTTLVDTYGLLNLKRHQFVDIQDQNATYLELAINGQQRELVYGSFSNQQASRQDQDEYQRLEKALTAITEALTGPTHEYNSTNYVLLARQIFSTDISPAIPHWPLADFTLAQVAIYECGVVPPDDSRNAETACLKYTRPRNSVLLTPLQYQTIRSHLDRQGDFIEEGRSYAVILRPLLPDELPKKMLAMFGCAQASYSGVPLHDGPVPASRG